MANLDILNPQPLEYKVNPNYNKLVAWMKSARATMGANETPVNQGSCVAIGLTLAGLVSPEQASIAKLLQFQNELRNYLDHLQPQGEPFPSVHHGGFTNHCYQEMSVGHAGTLVEESNLRIGTGDDIQQARQRGALFVGILCNVNPPLGGRPPTHAVAIHSVNQEDVIVLSDFDPSHKCIINPKLTYKDENLILGTINVVDLLNLANDTSNALSDFYGKPISPWRLCSINPVGE